MGRRFVDFPGVGPERAGEQVVEFRDEARVSRHHWGLGV